MFLPQSERPSFAPIRHKWPAKLHFCILIFSSFLIWDGKTKDSRLNDSKHSLTLIYSWFHHKFHSDLCHPQVFEFCHIFKQFIGYPHILVLMMRHDYILCLLCIYF
jgi:hypothetical protein